MMRPILFRDLKPGCRVVSHAFNMGDWEQDDVARNPKARGGVVYLWTIPAPVGGTWQWPVKVQDAEAAWGLALQQEFQFVRGFLTVPGAQPVRIGDTSLKGRELSFTASVKVADQSVKITYRGTADGDTIQGTQEWSGGPNAGRHPWTAKRQPADIAGTWQVKVAPADRQLDGTLLLARKDNVLTATYTFDKGQAAVSPVLYVWGASVRFDVPGEGRTVDFKGTLGPDAGSGSVQREGWSEELTWSAQKVKP
jgi:hypothetical protein